MVSRKVVKKRALANPALPNLITRRGRICKTCLVAKGTEDRARSALGTSSLGHRRRLLVPSRAPDHFPAEHAVLRELSLNQLLTGSMRQTFETRGCPILLALVRSPEADPFRDEDDALRPIRAALKTVENRTTPS